MEKKSSHSQNYTLPASTIFARKERREKGKCGRAILNSKRFEKALLSLFSPFILREEPASGWIASVREFKDEYCARIPSNFSDVRGAWEKTLKRNFSRFKFD